MSRQVTAVYADESTISRFSIDTQATVHSLKQRSCSELANTAERHYAFTNGFPHGDVISVVLSSGSYGQLDFDASTTILSVCKADEVIIATVPAPPKDSDILGQNTISYPLTSPLQSQIGSMLQTHIRSIHENLIPRIDEALKTERDKQEGEREKWEEALEVERAKREEALKAERQKREEALKVERQKREEALKVEREEREREKAEADKKYGLLKNHLLEVEETTMDTVGWIVNNDTKMLDRIKLRHLLNKAQEILAVATGLTQDGFGASLAWRGSRIFGRLVY